MKDYGEQTKRGPTTVLAEGEKPQGPPADSERPDPPDEPGSGKRNPDPEPPAKEIGPEDPKSPPAEPTGGGGKYPDDEAPSAETLHGSTGEPETPPAQPSPGEEGYTTGGQEKWIEFLGRGAASVFREPRGRHRTDAEETDAEAGAGAAQPASDSK